MKICSRSENSKKFKVFEIENFLKLNVMLCKKCSFIFAIGPKFKNLHNFEKSKFGSK